DEWTAHYVALRVTREPDAFPASDDLLRAAAGRNGTRPSPAALLRRAERWRPMRAYAAQHLWAAGDDAQVVGRRQFPPAASRTGAPASRQLLGRRQLTAARQPEGAGGCDDERRSRLG